MNKENCAFKLVDEIILQHILIMNIKNSATCFGSLSHHQAKTIVLVHPVSAYTIASHTVYRITLNFKIKLWNKTE